MKVDKDYYDHGKGIYLGLVETKIIAKVIYQQGIRWEKPPLGWKKLNTDGSVIGCMERAGCWGVVRDEHWNWVAGYTRHVGAINSFAAELYGLRDSLLLCSSLNISCLIVEIDAKVIVDVIKNSAYVNQIISPILDDCRQLMTRFQQVQLKHYYRHVTARLTDVLIWWLD